MADFELEDSQGNRYRIRRGAGPQFWHSENLAGGSTLLADELLCNVPVSSLDAAHDHFYSDVLTSLPNRQSSPQGALSDALSSSYLTIEKIGTALVISDDVPDPRNELLVKIRNALAAIVAGERAEAAMHTRLLDEENALTKGIIYTGAFMHGIGSSAWGMVVWLKEVSDVVNPFVKMQHHAKALQAAWESEDFSKTYSDTYVKGEKRELVEALGFDPTAITEQQIDEAMAMTSLVMDDPSVRGMLYQFTKDYAEAQHAIEVTNVIGSAVFEIILAIVMAAVTGGVGVVAAVGSKAHLIKKFQKVGDLLQDFAKATRSLKLQAKKRKTKGNQNAALPVEKVDAKKTDAHGAEDGVVSKKPSKKVEPRYVPMPEDLVADSTGVYGYVPTTDSQFHSSKWPVDWTNPDQVAKARTTRLDYHVGLDEKKQLVESLRKEGMSSDDIARKIVDSRNKDRLSHYKSPEALDVVYNRNLEKYGDKMGPTYDSQLSKYGSSDEVINAALRTNDSMDILTGISTPKGGL
jgi:hypothetical protein